MRGMGRVVDASFVRVGQLNATQHGDGRTVQAKRFRTNNAGIRHGQLQDWIIKSSNCSKLQPSNCRAGPPPTHLCQDINELLGAVGGAGNGHHARHETQQALRGRLLPADHHEAQVDSGLYVHAWANKQQARVRHGQGGRVSSRVLNLRLG